MKAAPSESQALREVRRALRWLRKAEATLAAAERRERALAKRFQSGAREALDYLRPEDQP